jgi:hypothetical protein
MGHGGRGDAGRQGMHGNGDTSAKTTAAPDRCISDPKTGLAERPPPASLGSVCTTTADCCSGYACSIPRVLQRHVPDKRLRRRWTGLHHERRVLQRAAVPRLDQLLLLRNGRLHLQGPDQLSAATPATA